jgi:subtilisin family serine protease
MGLLVGAVDNDLFGVAPGAEWITAGVIDQGRPNNATIYDILMAFEWTLNPDGDTNTTNDVPDVISNSWGIPKGLFEHCNEIFNIAIDNVEAAGIVVVFAAGNEGCYPPNNCTTFNVPRTLRSPADRASTPINSFAVGAISNSKTIANFSSRGPSSCNGAIKPEVVAPGVRVRSSYRGGYTDMSGTSMAVPYIAGLAVLYRQYDPDASVEEIKNAIINSCIDLGPLGEDNAYGYGLPDASRLLDSPTDTINDTLPTDTLLETSYTLYQNYPNPFRLTTYIEFSLPHRGEVSLRVFNILGQEVQTLRKGYFPAGRYINEWKMILPNKRFAAGVYLYVLTWNGRLQVKKMIALN